MSRPGSCGDELFPVGAHRIADRCRHDLEVLGAVGIGQYEEDVTAFFEVVLQADLARLPPILVPPADRRPLNRRYSDVS
jgi:hypothetical protein